MTDDERKHLNDLDRLLRDLPKALNAAFSAASNHWPQFPEDQQNEIGRDKGPRFGEVARQLKQLVMAAPALIRFLSPDEWPLPVREPLIQAWTAVFRVGPRGRPRTAENLLVDYAGETPALSPKSHGFLDVVGPDGAVYMELTRDAALALARRLGLAFGFEVLDTTERADGP